MQWLTLVSEDSGVQRLKADNRLPATAPDVNAVSPYPSTHAAQIGERPDTNREPVRDRRQSDRRRGNDRRKKQLPVVLDTRSNHDRRDIENRRKTQTASNEKPAAPARINVYA